MAARPAALRSAAIVLAVDIFATLLANLGCPTVLVRPQNIAALTVLSICATILLVLSRSSGHAANHSALYAQVPAGVAGVLIQPSLSILAAIAAGAFAVRALPQTTRLTVAGLMLLTAAVFLGYTLLELASRGVDPALIRC